MGERGGGGGRGDDMAKEKKDNRYLDTQIPSFILPTRRKQATKPTSEKTKIL